MKKLNLFFAIILWLSCFGYAPITLANNHSTAPTIKSAKKDLAPFIGKDRIVDLSKVTKGTYDLSNYDVSLEGDKLIAHPLPVLNPWSFSSSIPAAYPGLRALAVDGSGNVYIGGYFLETNGNGMNCIAKWDGTNWSALGDGFNKIVHTIAIDGSGHVYAGGEFNDIGGVANANGIAKWDGTNWSALGTGIPGFSGFSTIYSIAIDGSGHVYAGGNFTDAGGNGMNYFAKWDGTNWSALGTGLYHEVLSIAIDGNGHVYVGGNFEDAGGIAEADRIAKWDGTNWSALGAGLNNTVETIAIDESDNVYVGGYFKNAGGIADADGIAKWDGTNWSALGTGIPNFYESARSIVIDGSGHVYAGGEFNDIGGVADADGIAKWDGMNWSAVGNGLNNSMEAIAINGYELYALQSGGDKVAQFSIPAPPPSTNTSGVGDGALSSLTTGNGNTGVGKDALMKTTTGDNNTAYGALSLTNNIAGNNNTAVGYNAGTNNEGDGNIFLGHEAGKQETTASNKLYIDNSDTNTPLIYGEFDNDLLRINGELDMATHKIKNVVDPTADQDAATKKYVDDAVAAVATPGTSGSNNTAIGTGVLANVTTGIQNSGTGAGALANTTTGSFNTAYGVNALNANTTGSINAAFGRDALLKSNGNNNAAIGNRAMKNNTTGNSNSAIGNYSMEGNRTGNYNTAIGFESLRLSKTGNYNIAVGYRAMYNNDGGGFNAAIGYGALKDNVTGTKLTAIGNGADVTLPNLSNAMAIGSNAKVAGSMSIRLGNTSITNIEGQVAFTSVSDRKFKTNIEESTLGLEFIQQLNPVTYNMKEHGEIQYTGFIAQEVDELVKEMGREWSGVKRPANQTDHFGLRYAEFTVPLVKGMQEQQDMIEDLEKGNEELKTKNAELENRLDRLEKLLFQKTAFPKNLELTLEGNSKQAELLQNIPNPFASSTLVKAFIPQEVRNARLVITDVHGKVLLEEVIAERGAINTTINAKNLAQGNYIYSLILDDKLLASKTMVLVK